MTTRLGGKAISTRVPAFGALLMWKLARLASANALVSGSARPVPPEPQLPDVATWRNGSSAVSISFSLMPTPVSRTRSTTSLLSVTAVETITWPPGPVNLIELARRFSTIWRSDRSSATFVDAYREAMTDPRLWPRAADQSARLLDFFLIEKALYEIEYELSHRPQWVRVPLAGILRVLPQPEEVA